MKPPNTCNFRDTMDLVEEPSKNRAHQLSLSYLQHKSITIFNLHLLYRLIRKKTLKMINSRRTLTKHPPKFSPKRRESWWLSKDVRRALLLAITSPREEIVWFTLKTSSIRYGTSSSLCNFNDCNLDLEWSSQLVLSLPTPLLSLKSTPKNIIFSIW